MPILPSGRERNRWPFPRMAPSIATSIRRCRARPRCCRISTTIGASMVVMRGLDRDNLETAILSARLAADRAGPTGGRSAACPAATSRCCARTRSTRSARASRSATCCTARRSVQRRSLRRALPRHQRLDRRRNGSTAIRGCAPPSWCRCTARSWRWTRSSAAPPTRASCRCWCWAMAEMPARAAHQLADLSRRRRARPADRHPCRQHRSAIRRPRSAGGSYYLEDYVAQAQGFAGTLQFSLVTEGVFVEFPGLKVVLIESGVTWLPAGCGASTRPGAAIRAGDAVGRRAADRNRARRMSA